MARLSARTSDSMHELAKVIYIVTQYSKNTRALIFQNFCQRHELASLKAQLGKMSMDKKQLEDTIGKAVPCHHRPGLYFCLIYLSFGLMSALYFYLCYRGCGRWCRGLVFPSFFSHMFFFMSHVNPRSSGGSGVADYAPWAWWASCFRYLKYRVFTWKKGWVSGNSRLFYSLVCVLLCECA
jgi:hypothetical protein